MNYNLIKYHLLKKIYYLENNFDIEELEDCQHLLFLVSKLLNNKNNDEDILLAIQQLFERHINHYDFTIIEEKNKDNQYHKINDNDKNLNFDEHSISFQTLFSRRVFYPKNDLFNYTKIR